MLDEVAVAAWCKINHFYSRLTSDLFPFGMSYSNEVQTMRAISFSKQADQIIHARYGESNFKVVDSFWFDFKPDGGKKTTEFCPNLIKDTENNRRVVDELIANSIAQKAANDEFDKKMYQICNKIEK